MSGHNGYGPHGTGATAFDGGSDGGDGPPMTVVNINAPGMPPIPIPLFPGMPVPTLGPSQIKAGVTITDSQGQPITPGTVIPGGPVTPGPGPQPVPQAPPPPQVQVSGPGTKPGMVVLAGAIVVGGLVLLMAGKK